MGKWMFDFYSKHGTTKAKLLYDLAGGIELPSEETLEGLGLSRETFWKDAKALAIEAAVKGSGFHKELEDAASSIFAGEEPKTEGEFKPIFSVFSAWMKHEGVSIVASEKFVSDEEVGCGGTLDVIFRNRFGKEAIGDYKFTSALSKANVLQLTGYDLLDTVHGRGGILLRFYELKRPAKETGAVPSSSGYIFSEKGNLWRIEVHTIKDLSVYHGMFKCCLKLFHFLKAYAI